MAMSTRIVEGRTSSQPSPARFAPEAYSKTWALLLLASDVVLFNLALWLGLLIGFHKWSTPHIITHLVIAEFVYVLLWVFIFARLGLYQRTYALSMKDELYYTITALTLGVIPQFIVFTIFPGISTSRIALSLALVLSIVLVGSMRTLLHHARHSVRFRTNRRIALVGQSDRVQQVAENLDISERCSLLLITVDDMDQAYDSELALAQGTQDREWFNQSLSWGCDTVILTEIVPPRLMTQLLELAARHGVKLAFAPPRITRYAYSLSLQSDGRQALIVPSRLSACTPRAQLFKRLMDITLVSVALLLFVP